MKLKYNQGDLILEGNLAHFPHAKSTSAGDHARVPAYLYHEIIEWAQEEYEGEVTDHVKSYSEMREFQIDEPDLYQHQSVALDRWLASDQRGIVASPAGTGKTFLGLLAISDVGLPALIVTPRGITTGWRDVIERFTSTRFKKIDNSYVSSRNEIHITSYMAASAKISEIGDKYGLLILDDSNRCLDSGFQNIAEKSIAPYRLGLMRNYDEKNHSNLIDLIGPVVLDLNLDSLEHIFERYPSGVPSPYHLRKEIQRQESMFEDEYYRSVIIRQSGFFEDYLRAYLIHELEEVRGRELSNSEKSFIKRLGHTDRILFAHLMDIVSEDERNALLEMASTRNEIAHSWWLKTGTEEDYKRVAKRIIKIMKLQHQGYTVD